MPSTYKGSPISISSRDESYTEDGKIAVTVTFTGDVDVLRSQKPATGDELAGYEDDGVVVRSVKISRPGTGKLGTMVVEANNELSSSGNGGQPDTYELEWQRVDQDIRYHPIYAVGGDQELDRIDRAEVEYLLNHPEEASTATYDDMTDEAKHLYARLARGQTSYALYIPVARQTTTSLTMPACSGVGEVDNPPGAIGAPSSSGNSNSYVYVKTSDRRSKQGNIWTRTQEWTGFEQVDTDIIEGV
jgi:hypothetical protein